MEKQIYLIRHCEVNTASVGGLQGTRAGAAYTASKHAVVGFTKNTGFMYADQGIRCNAIAPGGVETNISTSMTTINELGWGTNSTRVRGKPTSWKTRRNCQCSGFPCF